MSRTVRSLLVLSIGIGAIAFAASRIVESSAFRMPKDFLQYWSSARLSLRGENPYDHALLLAEQQLADPGSREAVMMWNPPPALALYAPLAFVPARWAALLWICAQLLAVMVACDMLWRVYAPGRPRWTAQLVALSFVGTWWMVAYGQNTGLLVLGLAGYLHFIRKDRPIAAGALAALTALKPHLLAGFGVLLIADVGTRRGRASLLIGVSLIVLSLGFVLIMDPHVLGQFAATVRDPGPDAIPLHAWTLPVLSYWLRMAIAPAQFWIQFVPCLAACIGLVVWRIRSGDRWDWARALPVAVGISVLTTPYGGWIFDLPVLLVPVIWSAARLANHPLWLVAFLAGQVAITIISFATPGALHAYWWVAPSVLTLCLAGFRNRHTNS
jgi:Glycosyltransferase family 87